jgi:hypothetical protein
MRRTLSVVRASRTLPNACTRRDFLPTDQLRLGLAAERVAGGGMGHDDDLGRNHRQQTRGFVQAGDLAAVAFLLAGVGPCGPAGRQTCEVDRDAGWRQLSHLRFHRRIARRHQEPDPCPPSHHDRPSPMSFHSASRLGGSQSLGCKPRAWPAVPRCRHWEFCDNGHAGIIRRVTGETGKPGPVHCLVRPDG